MPAAAAQRTKSPSVAGRGKSVAATPSAAPQPVKRSLSASAYIETPKNLSAHTGPQKSCEVLIHGMLYDVTGFKHPGGGIIKFNMGTGDATEAFEEFHIRSPKATKMLHLLPSRPAPVSDKPPTEAEKRAAKMSKSYAALRQQLIAEGWFDTDITHVIYRIMEIVVMHIVGLYMLLNTSWVVPGLAILGIASGRCGWLMHEGGHVSMTGNIKVDHRLQEMIYGVGCGMSGGWWRNQHNKHHATPQKLKHDVDLDTLPLVAFHSKVAALTKKSPLMKAWVKIQNYTFAPITCTLVANFWQFFLHPRYIWRTKRYAEAFWIAVRYALMYQVAVAYGADFTTALLGYLLYDGAGGCYIFTNFALSHTHLGVVEADEHAHWIEYAGVYTININPVPMVNWWMGYLNFQIEHHLFPSMPQYKFVKLAPRVKKMLEENGIKYDVRGFFEAMKDTWGNLASVAGGV